jgi:hypothetical protein
VETSLGKLTSQVSSVTQNSPIADGTDNLRCTLCQVGNHDACDGSVWCECLCLDAYKRSQIGKWLHTKFLGKKQPHGIE